MKQVRKEEVKTPKQRPVVNHDSLEAMTAESDRTVSGVFKNLESPGQPGYVACRLYKGQLFSKNFFDGEIASIPLSVARYINQRISWPRHSHELDEKGKSSKRIGQMVQRYQFVSREFM